MPWTDRLCRLLLTLFPGEFRGDYGEAMTADFRDQQRAAGASRRAHRRLWLRTVGDMLRRARIAPLARDRTETDPIVS